VLQQTLDIVIAGEDQCLLALLSDVVQCACQPVHLRRLAVVAQRLLGHECIGTVRPRVGANEAQVLEQGQVMQPPPQKPESVQVAEIKAQTDQQQSQQDAQIKGEEIKGDMALKHFEIQEQMKLEAFKAEQQKQLEIFKARLQANVALQTAAMQPETDADGKPVGKPKQAPQIDDMGDMQQPSDPIAVALDNLAQATAMMAHAHAKPKRIIRGPDGRAAGVE